MFSLLKHKSEEIIDEKQKILNLTKIIPVVQASTIKLKLCPFFITKESMKDIYKNFPVKFIINNSDSLSPFIESDVNKDGDSYRSPWSNTSNTYFSSNKFKYVTPKGIMYIRAKT